MFPFWFVGVFVILSGISVLWSWNWIIGIIVIVVGGVIIFSYMMIAPKFPVLAYIFQPRGEGYKVIVDKVGRFRTGPKDDTFQYRFKKIRDTCPAARFDNLYPSGKGDIAFFFSPAPGEYHPLEIKEQFGTKKIKVQVPDPLNPNIMKEVEIDQKIKVIQPINDDLHSWFVQKAKRMKQKYENISGWDKYYPIIIIIVLAIALVLIFNSVLSGINRVSQTMEDAAKINQEAIGTMTSTLERMADVLQEKQQIPTGPGIPPDVG